MTESTPFQALGVVSVEPSRALPATPTPFSTAFAVSALPPSSTPMSPARLQKRGSPNAPAAEPSSLARPRSTRRITSSKTSRYWRLTPHVLPKFFMWSVRWPATEQPDSPGVTSKTARIGICFFINRELPSKLPRLASMRVSWSTVISKPSSRIAAVIAPRTSKPEAESRRSKSRPQVAAIVAPGC